MIKVGDFDFHLYGLMVGLGILVGFWVAARMAQKFSLYPKPYTLSPSVIWDAVWWVFIPGILGARVYHVLDFWEYYRENLSLILAIWTGGLGIFGAIAGGLVGLYFYLIWLQVKDRDFATLKTLNTTEITEKLLTFLDLAAFGLPVGQAIGRWGNFFNQEIYGKPFDAAQGKPPFFAISVRPESRLPGFEQYTHFHPLFLYECILSLLTFGLLLWLWRVKGVKLASGSYFSVYLVLYGVGRFFLEELRIESWVVGGVNVAKFLSLLAVLLGVVFLYSKNRK